MKKTNQIFIVLFILVIGNINYAQTNIITLHVNTDELTNNNVNSEEITYFTAPDSQVDVASPPEAFTITVEEGSTIIWEGVSSSNDEDTIEIYMIKRERGPRIFSSDEIQGNGNGRAQAVARMQTDGEPYKYKILFKVNGTGRMYKIDPKIKVRPRI
ncbi:hypothetical protein [Algibacter mikhailovii]|uniref:hypothetical protein n=1 Tax=Algibacter mikhailovii TaxID=425498 RepID=UPI0024957579|nr:hypothetical protein [Algibacter mikhailovii]